MMANPSVAADVEFVPHLPDLITPEEYSGHPGEGLVSGCRSA